MNIEETKKELLNYSDKVYRSGDNDIKRNLKKLILFIDNNEFTSEYINKLIRHYDISKEYVEKRTKSMKIAGIREKDNFINDNYNDNEFVLFVYYWYKIALESTDTRSYLEYAGKKISFSSSDPIRVYKEHTLNRFIDSILNNL